MYKDLREFIELVDKLHALRRIEGADPYFEIGGITEVAAGLPGGPALLFDEIKGYARGFRIFTNAVTSALRAALFLPVLIPMVAASALFLFIFLPNVGLLDHYIGRLLPVLPNWLGDPDLALAAIMVITVWKNAGYYMLFFLAGLQAVPEDVMEASYLDGAGPFQRLRYIILPELRPTFLFVTVIAILSAVTQVDQVFVMTKGGPSNSTNLLLFYIYQQAVEHYDVGRASAATLLTLAALMGLTALSFRSLARREGGP